MRRVSMAMRDELVAAVIERYSKGRRAEKGRILDAFVAVTGFHRKHAMRVLRGGQANRRSAPRPERRLYDEAVREALIVLWEASARVSGVMTQDQKRADRGFCFAHNRQQAIHRRFVEARLSVLRHRAKAPLHAVPGLAGAPRG